MARRIVSILIVSCYLLTTVGSAVWHDHAHVHHAVSDLNANGLVLCPSCFEESEEGKTEPGRLVRPGACNSRIYQSKVVTPLVAHSHCGHGTIGSHSHAHGFYNRNSNRPQNNQQPKPLPLHDDDCAVCQYFAEQPVETQSVDIVSTERLFEQVVILRTISTTACFAQLPPTRGPPC